MKRFLLPLLALCLWAPNVSAQEKEKPREPYTHEMANGLQIQVYDTDTLRDDTTDMLGIHLWKIRFSTKQKGKQVMAVLQLRTASKNVIMLDGVGLSPLDKIDIIFGVQPIDGDQLDSSPKTRFYIRFDDDRELRSPGNFHTKLNPFVGLGSLSIRFKPLVRANGSVLLVQFSPSGKDDDPKNSELVVVATLQDASPAK